MHTKNAQLVNKDAVIGHNRPSLSLSEAAQANLETGVLLLCKEALITAIQDKRLQRPHLRVLAAIATHINTRTAKAWPSRMAIAIMADLAPKSVSNVILQLRGWGYLVADRETVEQADGKRLTVYTFGNIDHDGIRRAITDFVNKLREQRDLDETPSSRPGGNSDIPPQQDVPVPEGIPAHEEFPPEQEVPAQTGTHEFPPQGELPAPTGIESSRESGKFPSERERSSRQDGDSNSNKELIDPRERVCASEFEIRGPNFVVDLAAVDILASTIGMPTERARSLAMMCARDWAANGIKPSRPMLMLKNALMSDLNQSRAQESRGPSGAASSRSKIGDLAEIAEAVRQVEEEKSRKANRGVRTYGD